MICKPYGNRKLIRISDVSNAVDIQRMIDAILKQRANLGKDDLLRMIEDKKQKIGAGYLTDQGALFLIAADLGIMLEELPKLEMSLKDIYAGAKEVNVIARVMNVYPLKEYRRKDGSDARLRTLVLYDKDTSLKMKLWDEMADIPDRLGIRPGDAVKISKAYARSGMDGKVTLNAGARTGIDLIDNNVPHIPDIEALTLDASEITGSEENVVVSGAVKNSPRVSYFKNFRGEPSKAMHLRIAGTDGKTFRVVIWNVDEERFPRIVNIDDRITLIGVRPRQGRYDGIELHGDEGTIVQMEEEVQDIEVMPLRIISVSRDVGKSQQSFILAVDKNNCIFTIVTDDLFMDQLQRGRIVECVPSRIYGNTLHLYEDAYVRTVEDDASFPDATSLERKIKDIEPSEELYFVEALTLTAPTVQDLQVRDGEQVKHAEVMIGDDTAEMKLVGWRESAEMIAKLSIGQKIKIYGVMAYTGRDGNTELRLKPFSTINTVNSN